MVLLHQQIWVFLLSKFLVQQMLVMVAQVVQAAEVVLPKTVLRTQVAALVDTVALQRLTVEKA